MGFGNREQTTPFGFSRVQVFQALLRAKGASGHPHHSIAGAIVIEGPPKPLRVFASDAAIYVKAIVRRTVTTATTAYPITSERSMVFRYANVYSRPVFRNANAYSIALARLTSFRNVANCDITSAPSRCNAGYMSWRALPAVKMGYENSHRY